MYKYITTKHSCIISILIDVVSSTLTHTSNTRSYRLCGTMRSCIKTVLKQKTRMTYFNKQDYIPNTNTSMHTWDPVDWAIACLIWCLHLLALITNRVLVIYSPDYDLREVSFHVIAFDVIYEYCMYVLLLFAIYYGFKIVMFILRWLVGAYSSLFS